MSDALTEDEMAKASDFMNYLAAVSTCSDGKHRIAVVRGRYMDKPVAVLSFVDESNTEQFGDVSIIPLAILVTEEIFDALTPPAPIMGHEDAPVTPPAEEADVRLHWCIACGGPNVFPNNQEAHGSLMHSRCFASADGTAIFDQHEMGDHSHCHPNGCSEAAKLLDT